METQIPLAFEIGSLVVVSLILAADLVVAFRRPHVPSTRDSALWIGFYVALALIFAVLLAVIGDADHATEFVAGWLTEYSLSIDNLFVFLLIMSRFSVPREYQQEILMVGIVIALVLRGDGAFDVGVVTDLSANRRHPERGEGSRPVPAPAGRFRVEARSPVRGIATSGWRGRSFSLGIADSVTVLATRASIADAAATVIANAVDVDDARIVRAPASSVRDDTDLGHRLVVRRVPPLPAALVEQALDRGVREAEAQIGAGRIIAAVLSLQGRWRVCGALHTTAVPNVETFSLATSLEA